VAIDASIGVPEMIGRGHGRAFLRAFHRQIGMGEGTEAIGQKDRF
jgi:hypothetical protein